jgi:hypothetical protein
LLILLLFFHQFNLLNFIILSVLLITVIFFAFSNNKNYTA